MLEGVVWSLPYAKDWQSCCAASQVCRAHCKKVVLAGAQVGLVMTGGCPQVFLVAGWFELCAIIQKQPAADLYLLSKSQWSAYSSHLQAETVNAFLVWVRETHNHYWAVIQGPNQQSLPNACCILMKQFNPDPNLLTAAGEPFTWHSQCILKLHGMVMGMLFQVAFLCFPPTACLTICKFSRWASWLHQTNWSHSDIAQSCCNWPGVHWKEMW